MEPGKARRSDNGGASEPAVQVVGFHVEGTPASPMPDSVWSSGMGAASPVPVIIPPSFQVRRYAARCLTMRW